MPGIDFIGHRGASRNAPENTLASFRLAWQEGADGIEGDFRLTADGEIVCLHDATTGRTAGTDLRVAATPLARLRQLDVGGWRGEEWRGERIPTLAEVLAAVPAGKKLYVELKEGPEMVVPLAGLLATTGFPPEQLVLLAFAEEMVAESARRLPEVKRLWLTDYRRNLRAGGFTPSVERIMETLARTGADGLASRAHRAVDTALAEALREAGLELHVWTVDTPEAARRFANLGARAIITNRPGWLRARLAPEETRRTP